MKKIISIAIILIYSVPLKAQDYKSLPANFIFNTFYLSTDTLSGTSFEVRDGENIYIVTAKHLFKRHIRTGDKVRILLSGKYLKEKNDSLFSYNVQVFIHKDSLADVAVFKIPVDKNKFNDKEMPSLQLALAAPPVGEDCIFLGYPSVAISIKTNFGLLPLVKKCVFSGALSEEILVFDGHNNKGFSGGPILSYSEKDKRYNFFAVVSGYYPEIGSTENSGIMFATHMSYVKEIIKSLPK